MPDAEQPPNQVVVSGLWLDKTRLPENGSNADIRILWHVHPLATRVMFSPRMWGRRRFYFWERVGHELVHRYQERDRDADHNVRVFHRHLSEDDETKEQQLYYADYDELEAYAHDAALEFVTWHPELTFSQAVASAGVSHSWFSYVSAFPPAHSAVIAFKRKARSWWDSMRRYDSFYERLSLPRVV